MLLLYGNAVIYCSLLKHLCQEKILPTPKKNNRPWKAVTI